MFSKQGTFGVEKEIIKKCTKDLHLPPNIFYFFIKLGAKIFGKFNIEETSPLEAIKSSKLPTILFHGDNDDFVPYNMSQKIYEANSNNNKLVIIPNAGHGLCYLVDSELYINSLKEFFI